MTHKSRSRSVKWSFCVFIALWAPYQAEFGTNTNSHSLQARPSPLKHDLSVHSHGSMFSFVIVRVAVWKDHVRYVCTCRYMHIIQYVHINMDQALHVHSSSSTSVWRHSLSTADWRLPPSRRAVTLVLVMGFSPIFDNLVADVALWLDCVGSPRLLCFERVTWHYVLLNPVSMWFLLNKMLVAVCDSIILELERKDTR